MMQLYALHPAVIVLALFFDFISGGFVG